MLDVELQIADVLYEEEQEEPIIMGIDPAIASIGFGVIQGSRAIDYGVISTSSKTPYLERLDSIYNDIKDLYSTFKPKHIAIENPFFGRENTNAGKVVAALGVIQLALHHAGVTDIHYLHQSQVKSQVSSYGASKVTIQAAVMQIFDLPGLPKPDDAADGLAIAYTYQQGVTSNIKY